jgi:ABC-2 type transport system permease protein/lipopolysaccharide transport system permease protein
VAVDSAVDPIPGRRVAYDSARDNASFLRALTELWRRRSVVPVLARREIVLRYKRSFLGIWWTLLNPLATAAVMYVVFSGIFHVAASKTPYLVYLLSGIVVVTLFQQALMSAAVAIAEGAGTLTKARVPAPVFPIAAVLALGVAFVASLVPLLLAQIFEGSALPWTALLVFIPAGCVMLMSIGLGMLIGTVAARFFDVLDITRLGLNVLTYLTPIFYPLSIIPHRFRFLIEANPIFQAVTVFRSLDYGAHASLLAWASTVGSAVLLFVVGMWWLTRNLPKVLVML